jgi:hypothetical protein
MKDKMKIKAKEEFFKNEIRKIDITSYQLTSDKKAELQINSILQGRKALHEVMLTDKILHIFKNYPWQTAFGLAALQTLICVITFGNSYTNFILGFLGGR